MHVLTTRVVLRRAGVAHSDDGTPHAVRSLLPVLLVTQDACPSATAGKGPTSCTSLSSGRAESRSRTRTPAGNWQSGANSASGTRTNRRSFYTARMYSIQDHASVRIRQAKRQAKWYAPHAPWLLMPDKASEHTCRRRQRDKDAMLRPGGGGSGGALPETPE